LKNLDKSSPDYLGASFAALADPNWRALLTRPASGETSFTELAEPFEGSGRRPAQGLAGHYLPHAHFARD
jgi:hypothetical protein